MNRQDQADAAETIKNALRVNGDFMSALEIMEMTGLGAVAASRTMDWMYKRQELLKRFRLGEGVVIVDVEEAPVPEFGYSRNLDNLLKGIGLTRKNWTDLQVDYGLDSGWSDEAPEDNQPIDPFHQIQPS